MAAIVRSPYDARVAQQATAQEFAIHPSTIAGDVAATVLSSSDCWRSRSSRDLGPLEILAVESYTNHTLSANLLAYKQCQGQMGAAAPGELRDVDGVRGGCAT